MTNKSLRSLAKDYANGVLSKDSYRNARNELLQGIVSGKFTVAKSEFRAPLQMEDPDITRDKTAIMQAPAEKKPRPTTEFVPPDPPPSPPTSSSPLKLILITSIIATIAVITIIFFYTKPEQQEQETLANTDHQPEISKQQENKNNAGHMLFENFLKANNWNDEGLQQFINDWNNLTDVERADTLSSPLKTQMANAINRQLLEERALFNLGGDKASVIERQRSLVNFADTIGIDDPRLTVQEFDESMVETPAQEETATADTSTENMPEDTTITEKMPENQVPADTVVNTEEKAAVSTENEKNEKTDTSVTENMPVETSAVVQEAVVEETKAPPAKPAAEPETASKTVAAESSTSTSTKTAVNKYACRFSLAKQRQPYCRDIIDGIGKGPTLVVVPAGKFTMGGEKPQELPKHEVVIPKPFAVAVNEITQGEFEQFCNDTQRKCPQQPWADEEYPVVNVTWDDAVAYTNWLSSKTGNQYRLPTEAEWEYAARARTKTKYPFGDEILLTDAVFSAIKPLTSPLPRSDRSINRNKFRLYHMVGNVREWVLDSWSENYNNASADGTAYVNSSSNARVVRGGSYADNDDALRSGARMSLPADNADVYTGFRIVQVLTN